MSGGGGGAGGAGSVGGAAAAGGAHTAAHGSHVRGERQKAHLTGADEAGLAIFLLDLVNKDIQAAIHAQPGQAGGTA
jgi:hypothetical protein